MPDDLLCKSCGASLPLPDGDGHSTCLSCGRNHRVSPRRKETEPTPPPGPGEPFATWTPDITITVAKPSSSGGSGGGKIVGLVVFLVVAAIIGSIVLAIAGSVKQVKQSIDQAMDVKSSSLSPTGTAIVLDSAEVDGPRGDGQVARPEVVSVAYDSASSSRVVVKFQLSESEKSTEPDWTSRKFPSSVYDAPLAQMGDRVMAAVGDDLWAINLQTGANAWTTALPDTVKGACDTCFTVVDDTLLVVTSDGQLLAFGAGSPDARWTRRLESPSARVLISDAGVVVADDNVGQPGQQIVMVLDPATGVQRSALVPTCAGGSASFPRTMNFADDLVVIPGGTDLLATVSSIDSCLVRWDGSTGQIRWISSVASSLRSSRGDPLVTSDRLFTSGSDGSMVAVNLTDGTAQTLVMPADVSAVAVGVAGDTLVAETRTTRGTAKGGLVGWDLATGQPRWQTAMADRAVPVSDRSSSSEALFEGRPLARVEVVDGQVKLITFNGDDYSVSVQSVDPATGSLGEAKRWTIGSGPGTMSVSVKDVSARGLLISADRGVSLVPLIGSGEMLSWPARKS